MAGVHTEAFACFGGQCAVSIEGDGPYGDAPAAAQWARGHLLSWHEQFSRFRAESELSCLNADPREVVPASPLMLELAGAVRAAGEVSGGLVDGTLIAALEGAGYDRDRPHAHPLGSPEWVDDPLATGTVPAGPSPLRNWSTIQVDRVAGTIERPPGVAIDSGGLVKGLLADVLCMWLAAYDDVVVDCCGDARFGGQAPGERELEVAHPAGGDAAVLEVTAGAVATSGTSGRRWRQPDGSVGHHLIDPSTGLPARTGVMQVTALAPTALEAEVLAKWALLSGAETGARRLVHGGVIVEDDGRVREVAARAPSLVLPRR